MKACGPGSVLQGALCSLTPYLSGAGFLASCLAIYNLVKFEQSLGEVLEQEQVKFGAMTKFISVKLLVSIVFFLEFGLEVFFGTVMDSLSPIQIKLAYSCAICYALLPISILVYVAWKPHTSDWYQGCTPENYRVQLAGEGEEGAARHEGVMMWREIQRRISHRIPSSGDLEPNKIYFEVRGAQERDCQAIQNLVETLTLTEHGKEPRIRATYRVPDPFDFGEHLPEQALVESASTTED